MDPPQTQSGKVPANLEIRRGNWDIVSPEEGTTDLEKLESAQR
jgi:hypothetical protein